MIYIITHKEYNFIKLHNYLPLHVGAEGKKDLGYQKDNEGENISNKNAYYCELTGLYWIWKNTEDEYKGIVHYRRYFTQNRAFNSPVFFYKYKDLCNMLKDYDIIVPKTYHFGMSIKEQLILNDCTEEIFSLMRACVKRIYPEYMDSFDQFFSGNKGSFCNMMFCNKVLFDNYCAWLFSVLFELERQITEQFPKTNQSRLYGYLAERLLNVWLLHNNFRVKGVPIINTELSLEVRMIQKIKHIYECHKK